MPPTRRFAVAQPCSETLPKIKEAPSVSSDDAQLKTAFVFAGGGSLGAIHVGMLRSLARRGIAADSEEGSLRNP